MAQETHDDGESPTEIGILLALSDGAVKSGDAPACSRLAAGMMSAAAYLLACTTDPSQDGKTIGTFGRLLADCRNAGNVAEIVDDIQSRAAAAGP